jgi:hypothetical protein
VIFILSVPARRALRASSHADFLVLDEQVEELVVELRRRLEHVVARLLGGIEELGRDLLLAPVLAVAVVGYSRKIMRTRSTTPLKSFSWPTGIWIGTGGRPGGR